MLIPLSENYRIKDFLTTPLVLFLIFSLVAINFAIFWDENHEKKHIKIIMPGNEINLLTQAKSVRDAISEAGIDLSKDYLVIPGLDTLTNDGMKIKLIKRKIKIVENTVKIYPEDNIIKHSTSYPFGTKVILRKSKVGIRKDYYKIVYYNDIPVIKKKIRTEWIRKPLSGIVIIGSGKKSNNPKIKLKLDKNIAYTKSDIPEGSIIYIPKKGYFITKHAKKRLLEPEKQENIYFLK